MASINQIKSVWVLSAALAGDVSMIVGVFGTINKAVDCAVRIKDEAGLPISLKWETGSKPDGRTYKLASAAGELDFYIQEYPGGKAVKSVIDYLTDYGEELPY